MLITQLELNSFNKRSRQQILNDKSDFVCEISLSKGFKLQLFSIYNYFVEVLVDGMGNTLDVKPLTLKYVANFYCRNFDLDKEMENIFTIE
jgi:hypothetical protein